MNNLVNAIGYREALRLAKQNHGMKFMTLEGEIISLTGLRKVIKGYFGRDLVKYFDDKIQYSYIPIRKQKQIKRWDDYTKQWRKHAFDCEFATGEDCTCWCGEIYHGWKGEHLDFKPQIKIPEQKIQESSNEQ